MNGTGKYLKTQLLGLKCLPAESGAWGFLLPRGKERATHEPGAHEQVQDINPAYLTFVDSEMNVDGGMWLTIGIFISSYMLLGAITFLPPLLTRDTPLAVLAVVIGVFLLAIIGPAILVYRVVINPIKPPVVISRKARRVYVWRGEKAGWRALKIDSSYPFVFCSKLISTAGATTIYTLQLAELDANRAIVESAVLGPFSRIPDECGRQWEFIRRYMDATPDEVPSVLAQPPANDVRATLARMDRVGSSGLVSRDFRLKKSLFAWCYFSFHGIVSYWWLRAAAWLQCRGKYPEYSAAMAEAMTFDGPNPYRREPLSAVEEAAFEGRLTRLRIRWAIVGILSTLLWGGLWLAMASPMVAMWVG
ncbi:hypothetical protein [Cupriavidus taiwanensis]|uniref:Uncharacterized protein n=1 Tax=Cupriavidus taiwanensis TaxID=164546 RepID=A0A375J3P3_9BURK|nr:hypothetical protein [Cupriavidus taiwanensis]SPR99825.1 membrane hypothetical protein [Cupriavidus taiwanensis]